eukprot:15454752-Alexandrium_andersonii.AAC.1
MLLSARLHGQQGRCVDRLAGLAFARVGRVCLGGVLQLLRVRAVLLALLRRQALSVLERPWLGGAVG